MPTKTSSHYIHSPNTHDDTTSIIRLEKLTLARHYNYYQTCKLDTGSSLEYSHGSNADGSKLGIILGVEFLQLGKDVFAVRVLA